MAKNNKRSISIKSALGGMGNRAIRNSLSKTKMKSYMTNLAETVRVRTRLGWLTKENRGKRERVKPLKPSTIKGRARLKRKGELSDKATVKRSSLTRTGQMLDALAGFGRGLGKGEIRVKSTVRKGDSIKNDEVAGYAAEGGRPFLNLTKTEIKQVGQEIKKELVKQFNKK